MRTLLIAAAVGMTTLTLVACGGDDLRDEIAADLQASAMGMISESEAECAADAVIEALGRENARAYAAAMSGDFDSADELEPLTSEQQMAMAEGLEACDFGAMQP